ncbi:MAG: hypothetical protein RL011_1136 [Pseudomonadota bacterium]|jgi:predicted deacylase
MAHVLQALVFWLITPGLAWGISFQEYHNQDEIRSYLVHVAAENPQLVRFQNLGYSDAGRPIDLVTLTSGDPETLPAIYINGTHHGDEKSSTEATLGIVDYLVKHKQEVLVRELLGSYVLYIQPMVNPDGHAVNTRFDANGVDPNRDYAIPGRTDDDAFRTPIIRLVRDLMRRVKFRAALALHSGMEGVLWAWGHSSERPPDVDQFFTIARLMARAMGIEHYRQSFADYPSQGEFIDYAYMNHGTLALTLEVSRIPAPPPKELGGVVRRAIAGMMTFMLAVSDLDRGFLTITRNSPSAQDIIPWARGLRQERESTH